MFKKIWKGFLDFVMFRPYHEKKVSEMETKVSEMEATITDLLQKAMADHKAEQNRTVPMNANTEVSIQPKITRQMLEAEVNIEVPEIMIQQASMAIGGDNNFSKLLLNGQAYRGANLTPIYLTNAAQTMLRVSAREYFENPRILN